MKIKATLVIGLVVLATACQTKNTGEDATSINTLLENRYEMLLNYPVDSTDIPRSYTKATKEVRGVRSKDWTSGFFPGNLWQIYRITGKEKYLAKAKEWTAFVEKEKMNGGDHDIGFRMTPCFGNGYNMTKDEHYKEVLIQSAKTLCTRYTDAVGAIRSWDFNAKTWDYPVIIDNMLNLELLFEASLLTGDSTYYNVAVNHADKTLENHFREDHSVYHVIDYDPTNGEVRLRHTHQGLHHNSTWARGQAWAIYGFSMTYRYTNDKAYLDQAIATAKFFLEHEKLPKDGITFWDFDDPKIPNTHKDASASAVVCSALYELYAATNDKYFLDKADMIMKTLLSTNYILPTTVNIPFVLDYSTGNKPKEDELDEPISYGDYYFLEALARSKNK